MINNKSNPESRNSNSKVGRIFYKNLEKPNPLLMLSQNGMPFRKKINHFFPL